MSGTVLLHWTVLGWAELNGTSMCWGRVDIGLWGMSGWFRPNITLCRICLSLNSLMDIYTFGNIFNKFFKWVCLWFKEIPLIIIHIFHWHKWTLNRDVQITKLSKSSERSNSIYNLVFSLNCHFTSNQGAHSVLLVFQTFSLSLLYFLFVRRLPHCSTSCFFFCFFFTLTKSLSSFSMIPWRLKSALFKFIPPYKLVLAKQCSSSMDTKDRTSASTRHFCKISQLQRIDGPSWGAERCSTVHPL